MENHNQPKLSPKFFFLSLGVIVSLITSVTAFLSLAFETLDFKFPDVLNSMYQYGYSSYNFDSTRMDIAILIIFLPIFLILMHWYKKTIREGLGKTDETIRKWTAYLIIFLAVLVAAIDLVTLVRYFVGGEITTRFIIKVLVTLVTAKWIGLYFFYEIRDAKWKKLTQTLAPWVMTLLSLGLIVWSFLVIGTPGEQRLWRLDDRRVNDLSSIQSQVITYWQQKEKLPTTLTDIANPTSYYSLPVDPEFEKGKTYEYKSTGALSFELCATFSADMPKGWVEYGKGGIMPPMPLGGGYSGRDTAMTEPAMYPYQGSQQDSWDHGVGRKCFSRTIDPDIHKPYDPRPVDLPVKE